MTRDFEPLTVVSSIDGRYRATTEPLAEYFSEYALIRARTMVECRYLIALSQCKGLGMRALTTDELAILEKLCAISLEDARLVKKIEREGHAGIPATNHDLKATEYLIRLKLKDTTLADTLEWVHFALTSEDADNVALALLLRGALTDIVVPALEKIRNEMDNLATTHAGTPMLARTHGQPASPTTFGKEMRVFEARLARQIGQLKSRSILVKWAGASGNFNAHVAGAPSVDWPGFAEKFIAGFNDGKGIVIELNPHATQIEPHDTYAELFDTMRRANVILIGFAQNIWRYISDGWVTQKPKVGEVGSSTMPHKVNPIDFENAEGNLGVADALFNHFSEKLPITRLQRDLSDSTVKRAFGVAFGHSLIAYQALLKGLGKISVNTEAMGEALDAHPEVLAEAIQTILRREGVKDAYELLKNLTRGEAVTLESLRAFVDTLPVSDAVKSELKQLTPRSYIGLASKIAKGA